MPETRGRTLEDIDASFRRGKAIGSGAVELSALEGMFVEDRGEVDRGKGRDNKDSVRGCVTVTSSSSVA